MCFSSGNSAPATPAPAAPPPAPAIPATQSATAAAAEPTQQIGFARKRENRRRFGRSDGPRGRRSDDVSTSTGDTGSGIRM